MPAISWSTLDSDLAPLPAWRFYCQLPAVAGGNLVDAMVERISATIGTIEVETVPFNAGTRNFAMGRSIDALTITFVETTKLDVLNGINTWMDKTLNKNGDFAMPATYWQTITLQPLDEQGNVAGTFTYTCAFPTHVQGFDQDGSQVNHVSPVATFSVNSGDSLINGV